MAALKIVLIILGLYHPAEAKHKRGLCVAYINTLLSIFQLLVLWDISDHMTVIGLILIAKGNNYPLSQSVVHFLRYV